MPSSRKRYFYFALFFILGFTIAMLASRAYFQSASKPVAAAPQDAPIDRSILEQFLKAATDGDYGRMESIGNSLFLPGTTIPDGDILFREYASNSAPPYTVYALYSEGSAERVRRVLLTLDDKNRVESFLAEEMAVIQ